MNNKCLLIAILTLITSSIQAQIRTYREWDGRSTSYKIYAENKYYGYRVIHLTFEYITDGSCSKSDSGFITSVKPGRNLLCEVRSITKLSRPKFKYKTKSYNGHHKKKPDFDYPYLLPVKNKSSTIIDKHSYAWDSYLGIDPPRNWYSLSVKTNVGDTIYAARMGTVTKVKNSIDNSESKQKVSFTSEKNFIRVQHKDGTTASYSKFKVGGNLVDPGDKVYPGQAIAISDAANYNYGSHFSFSVYYYDRYPKVKNGETIDEMHNISYVPIKFNTENGLITFEHCGGKEIVANHDDNTIKYEMSKKELKKYKKWLDQNR